MVLIFLWWRMRYEDADLEAFFASTSKEETVLQIYQQLLERAPTAQELVTAVQQLTDGTLTESGLRQRLMDRDEYVRLIKVQSNSLAPELPKMLSEREILGTTARLYYDARGQDIPPKAVLPLRDVFMELKYNEFAFQAFLADKSYPAFEKEVVLRTNEGGAKMSREEVTKMLEDRFDTKELVTAGAELQKVANEKAAAVARDQAVCAAAVAEARTESIQAMCATVGAAGVAAGAAGAVGGVSGPEGTLSGAAASARGVHDEDGNMTSMMQQIDARGRNVFDKDEVARQLDGTRTLRVPVRAHQGDMVLRPEFAWAVPQDAPPVCTSLGQRPLIQPLLSNSKLLLGTPLDDAADTAVGSIMPKFEFKPYVDLPVAAA